MRVLKALMQHPTGALPRPPENGNIRYEYKAVQEPELEKAFDEGWDVFQFTSNAFLVPPRLAGQAPSVQVLVCYCVRRPKKALIGS